MRGPRVDAPGQRGHPRRVVGGAVREQPVLVDLVLQVDHHVRERPERARTAATTPSA